MADRRGRRRGFVLVGLLAGTAGAGAWWYLRRVGSGAPVTDEWAAAVARPAAQRVVEGGGTASRASVSSSAAGTPSIARPPAPAPTETTDVESAVAEPAVVEPAVEPAVVEPAVEPVAESVAESVEGIPDDTPDDTPPAPLFAAATPSGSTGFAPTGEQAPPTDDTPTLSMPAVNPEEPYGPGSAAPLPDGSSPGPEYTIKGNASSMLFHTPASPYFQRTKPEAWFRSAAEAEKAGFTEWKPKPRAT